MMRLGGVQGRGTADDRGAPEHEGDETDNVRRTRGRFHGKSFPVAGLRRADARGQRRVTTTSMSDRPGAISVPDREPAPEGPYRESWLSAFRRL
jgi:hypothetical protein